MSPVDLATESPSDRAVRCALQAGVYALRLARVAEVVETWDDTARQRIIAGLGDR